MDISNEKVSVMPTDRDFAILKGLYDFVVMSFPQMSVRYFADKAKPTIVNRLTKLESAGLIQRLRVPRLEVGNSQNVISVVFQITRFGIKTLQKRHPEFELRPEPVRLRPYSVDHDLLLVDVMTELKNRFPASQIIHGELYFNGKNHLGLRPDAILQSLNGIAPIAIELELTAKSEKRYRDLILKYRLTKDFSQVIYITGHQQIENKIKAILGSSNIGERFKFMQLKEFYSANSNRDLREESEALI